MNPAVLFAGILVFASVLGALTSIATMLPAQPAGWTWFHLAIVSAMCAAAATWLPLSVLIR